MTYGALQPHVEAVLAVANDAATTYVGGAKSALITFPSAASLSGGTVVVESNINGAWWPVAFFAEDAPTTVITSLTTLAAAPTKAYRANVAGASQVRVKLSAVSAGTLTARIRVAD
jgi:hypothetical protein